MKDETVIVLQVLIQGTGEGRIIALGVLNEDFDCHKIPGCGIGTVGYHVDDGKIFEGGYPEVGREIEGMGYFDCRSRIYSNFYGGFVPLQSLLVLPLK